MHQGSGHLHAVRDGEASKPGPSGDCCMLRRPPGKSPDFGKNPGLACRSLKIPRNMDFQGPSGAPARARWPLVLFWLLACLLGIRVGVAKNPGPAHDLEDPDGQCGWSECQDSEWDEPLQVDDPWMEPPSDLAGQPFLPAKKFAGSKAGYAFKTSSLGLGYHVDAVGEPAPGAHDEAGSTRTVEDGECQTFHYLKGLFNPSTGGLACPLVLD